MNPFTPLIEYQFQFQMQGGPRSVVIRDVDLVSHNVDLSFTLFAYSFLASNVPKRPKEEEDSFNGSVDFVYYILVIG